MFSKMRSAQADLTTPVAVYLAAVAFSAVGVVIALVMLGDRVDNWFGVEALALVAASSERRRIKL
jgi:uncharacterized membrane protein